MVLRAENRTIGTGSTSSRRGAPAIRPGVPPSTLECVAFIVGPGRTDDLLSLMLHHATALKCLRLVACDQAADLLEEVGLDVERVAGEGFPAIGRMVMRSEVSLAVHLGNKSSICRSQELLAFLSLCDFQEVPFATNLATAHLLLSSPLGWEIASSGS